MGDNEPDLYCDYCGTETDTLFMRIIGFAEEESTEYPLMKLWCRECEPNDEIDPVAYTVFTARLRKDEEE